MFVNEIKNTVAFEILLRIHALRIAKEKGLYDFAETLSEALDTTSDRMNDHTTEKEYNALHRFWVKLKKIRDNEMRGVVVDLSGTHAVIYPPRPHSYHGKLRAIWKKRAKCSCICKSPRSCPQCEGWNG
jgi:hypothetical protein